MCGSSSWSRITDFHSVHTGSNPVPHTKKLLNAYQLMSLFLFFGMIFVI